MKSPSALIAEDEPLLRKALSRLLTDAWPELHIVAQARNGREAVEQFDALKPDICFLDVHMPGLSGVEAARLIGRRAHIVFVTAYDKYAVEAFEQGALDYLVKPVEPARLADTVARLQQRLREADPTLETETFLERLEAHLNQRVHPAPLRWLRVSVGHTVRLVPVEEIDYLRSDEKYTRVAWRDAAKSTEALIRTSLKELVAQLDPERFVQVHRSVVVNLRSVSHITRGDNETAQIHLKNRRELLPVSSRYLHLFRQM